MSNEDDGGSRQHLFKPGQSGNPNGRPVGARSRLSEAALQNMLESWGNNGPTVLEKLAKDDPATYARLAFSIIPKDVAISVEHRGPGGVDPGQWALMRRVLDVIEASGVDAEPEDIFEEIEHSLRARFARPVDAQSVHVVCTDAKSSENAD